MAILQSSKDRLKSAPLSKVIEELGGKLKRVGREFVTQCIWHDDTNPSLTINDDKGFCFCHVCREGGDVISYVQKRKGLQFFDAANLAAEILGIQLETDGIDPERRKQLNEERKRQLARLEEDQSLFRANLRDPRAGRIRDVLKGRGIEPGTSKEFGLGFASDGYFDGRITIPIHNYKNELVGWTGRATRDGQMPKYKNSADKPGIFEKKSIVFNEPRGKEAARMAGSLIFVEGHLDVVSLWQHGVENVVAMQGTGAPDVVSLQRLARSVRNFILCFDGDEGGKKAVQQFISAAGPLAQRGEVQISVASLPKGRDPDEICREEGVEKFHEVLQESISWLDWVIDFWAADLDKDNSAHVTQVEEELKKVIDGLQSNALRAHYVDKVSRALARDEKDAAIVAKNWTVRSVELKKVDWRPRTAEETRIAVERRAIRLFVHKPEHRALLKPLLANVTHPPLRWLCERLEELEQHSEVDLTPHSIMAVVAVAEPHFLAQLRTIVKPNVNVDDSAGVLEHCGAILTTVSPGNHDA